MNIDDYISQIDRDLNNQLSQLNDSINQSLGLGIDGASNNTTETPDEEEEIPAEETSTEGKQCYLLRIELNEEKYYQISPAPTIEDLRKYFGEELDNAGVEDDEITEDNISIIINMFDGIEDFGNESCNDHDYCVTGLGDIDLIKSEEDEEWYETSWREADETYQEYDVNFEPGEVEILDDGITITGPQPTCRNCFTLYLDEDEDFDPELLSIRNGCEDGSMIVCEYDGVPLRFEGMGRGDEDLDYYDEVHVYLNGEEIDYTEEY